MYVPASFAVTELAVLHDFIERHSFATLVSHDGREPFASHVPLLLDREAGPNGWLVGHVARANPQWKHAGGQRVLAIFNGPHAYISPTWYAAQNVVPTWNYVAVHAYGVLQLIDDRERLREIVRRTVAVYEANMPQPWSVDAPEASFVDKLLEAIVGFEIEVDRIEGKWKLNQNHDVQRRQRVVEALRAQGSAEGLQIADLMVEPAAAPL
jgi:transcriptional regulator